MSTQRERFLVVLTGQYRQLFETPEYAMAKARHTPEGMAEKMLSGMIDGTANKDGEGIKRTCKALGVPHTYKAIKAFCAA